MKPLLTPLSSDQFCPLFAYRVLLGYETEVTSHAPTNQLRMHTVKKVSYPGSIRKFKVNICANMLTSIWPGSSSATAFRNIGATLAD